MPNFVYIAASIDGFIARKDGNIDWLTSIPNPDNNDYGYAAFMNTIDAIVMGRNTFQTVASFDTWPYQIPVFVLSTTLKSIPQHLSQKSELLQGPLPDFLKDLHSRGYNNLYIDGGKTIQQFLSADLIDEITITRIPIVLGSGIPLFSNDGLQRVFTHNRTKAYDNGLVKSHYFRRHEPT